MTEYSTKDYVLEIGVSREDGGAPAYHVINKDSRVVEYEDYMLPRTIDSMVQIQERLNESIVNYNKPEPLKFSVIEPKSMN